MSSYDENDAIESGDCVSETDMLLMTLDSGTASRRTIEHMLTCGPCSMRLANLRRVVAEVAAQPGIDAKTAAPGPACLDEAALAQLIDDVAGRPATRGEIVHLVACAHCRGELASLAALTEDPVIADEIQLAERQFGARPDRRRRSRWMLPPKLVGALAAAAVVLLVVRVGTQWSARSASLDGSAAAPHRAPTIAAMEAPRSLFPVGDVQPPRAFIWSAVSGSDRYRLTLYDGAGHVVYEAQVRDTSVALPDSVKLARGAPYVWQVEARTAIDRWTSSETAEFVVRGAR